MSQRTSHSPDFSEHLALPVRAKVSAVHWVYNAWGKKYPPWQRDQNAGRAMAEAVGAPCIVPGFVLEGGSIEVNGSGTLLTTEQCLLHPNRNPGLSRPQIEERLRSYLGITQIIWLGEGIVGDDTDGHIDDIARFVDPRTVVIALEGDPHDENYSPLQDNYRRLIGATDQDGRPLKIVKLPMPRPVIYAGQRLPASYANFYIANGAVLVPLFDDPNDPQALAILQPLFPGRRVIGIPAGDLVIGLGGVHCVTQQQPA